MFALEAGLVPVQKKRAIAARAAAAAILAALGGCASTSQTTSQAQYSGAPVRVAQTVTDVEDDGLPAQTPPPARARQMADDPSEPFSRNYGGANPSASNEPLAAGPADHHAPAQKLPNDLPPAFRQKLVAALAEDE
jgi:hypothetical protein